MNLDVPSKQELDSLSTRVLYLEKESHNHVKELDNLNHRIDFLVSLLKNHLSPLDLRKLKNRGF
jgi:DNA-dependent RNA polymerase auxiliary subunit epsilon